MINFIKRTVLVLFFVVIIFANMVLIHADFPWAWIPIGIDAGLIAAVFIMTIITIYTSDSDTSSHLGPSSFGSKPKSKKKKATKKKSTK